MNKKQKKLLKRIIISAVLFAVMAAGQIASERMAGFVLKDHWYGFIPWLIPYAIVGYDIVWKAIRNISKGKVFDEDFLMMIATVGAFGVGEYMEGCAVMLLFQVGELFQSYAVGKSRASISDLMNIVPEYANLETDGVLSKADPEDVHIDDIIVIRPGERVPLDGEVIDGDSFLDTSSLTGESVPRHVGAGDEVISGCINNQGTLRVRVSKEYEDSTVSRILELVENASSRKAHMENFITRFAKYYTPVVTVSAILLAIIPPVFLGVTGGDWSYREIWSPWIIRACTFLVVSCPCALVISVPLGFFAGIGAASRIGVLVKGSNYLEALGRVKNVVFDKTGTLTKGSFSVTEIVPAEGISPEEVLEIAALSECFSTHPIGQALLQAYGKEADIRRIRVTEELAGYGVAATIDGVDCYTGNAKLMEKYRIPYRELKKAGTVVHVASSERYLGAILISDEIKEGVPEAIRSMRAAGVKTVMLTGDRKAAAEAVSRELGIDEVHSDLLPQDKVSELEKILEKEGGKEQTAFVGDGINDAPVLMRADIGIAMGSLGSDAAIEAADIVLMDDDVRKISKAVLIARKTVRIVQENIWFALLVKAAVLILTVAGVMGRFAMWIAVFADVGVCVLAILNSMRAMKVKEK